MTARPDSFAVAAEHERRLLPATQWTIRADDGRLIVGAHEYRGYRDYRIVTVKELARLLAEARARTL
jgi:hypothetical protein